MARVIWTEPALNDLYSVAEYIALSNLEAAQQLVQKTFDKVGRLEEFPESGRKPPEFEQLNYREVLVNPCRIFYRIEASTVYIVHVMRQEQQLKIYLFDE